MPRPAVLVTDKDLYGNSSDNAADLHQPASLEEISTTLEIPSDPIANEDDNNGWEDLPDDSFSASFPEVNRGFQSQYAGQSTYKRRRVRKDRYKKDKVAIESEWASGDIRNNLKRMLIRNCTLPECSPCSFCGSAATISCITCGLLRPMCDNCAIRLHGSCPEHRVLSLNYDTGGLEDEWNKDKNTTQLQMDVPCKMAESHESCISHRILAVGMESSRWVYIRFCNCYSLAEAVVHSGYWPVTPKLPRMMFTLSLMNIFRRLNSIAHLSSHGFIQAIKFNDPTLPEITYANFQSAYLEYRAAQFDIDTLMDFELPNRSEIIGECVACPRKNEDGDMHISLDGCFRLNRYKWAGKYNIRQRSMFLRFADRNNIRQYLSENGADTDCQKDIGEGCDNHFRASQPLSKNQKHVYDEKGITQLFIIGVFGTFCARHEMPLVFTDVYHGERFAYPNYLMEKLLKGRKETQRLFIYFDRSCRYVPHLKRRKIFAAYAQRTQAIIPKVHCYGHEYRCLRLFHPTRNDGCGLTDGECCERCWSFLGNFAKMTKEMLFTNRSETLEDALLHFGELKVVKLKRTLNARCAKAKLHLLRAKYDLQALNVNAEEARQLWLSEKEGLFSCNINITTLETNQTNPVIFAIRPVVSKIKRLVREQKSLFHLLNTGNLGQFAFQGVRKRLKIVKTKIARLVADYNQILVEFPNSNIETLTINTASDTDSLFWNEGKDLWKETTAKIDAYCRVCRAEEELIMISKEISRIDKHINDDIITLENPDILPKCTEQADISLYSLIIKRKVRFLKNILFQRSPNVSNANWDIESPSHSKLPDEVVQDSFILFEPIDEVAALGEWSDQDHHPSDKDESDEPSDYTDEENSKHTEFNEMIVTEFCDKYGWKRQGISQGDYIQGVLAPELAISLIAEDFLLDVDTNYLKCYDIWKESQEYGDFLYP